jgi:hypothetical protein
MIKNKKNKNKLLLIDILLNYTKVIKYLCDEIGKKYWQFYVACRRNFMEIYA